MIRRLGVLAVLVVALGIHTVVTNRETKPAEAAGAKVVDLPGGDLRYRDQGDRDDPAMVLLHGFAGSLRWWDRVAPDLVRRGWRVIRFDLLGHGGSEKPRDGYGMEDQAERVAAALDELGVRRAVFVGHSMGGTVTSALADVEPELVDKAVVIGTAPRSGFSELPLTARIATWPVVGQLARRLAPDQVISAGLHSAFAEQVEVPDAFVDDLDGMTYSAYERSRSASDSFNDVRTNGERLAELGRPLLVIFGAEDEIVDPKAAAAWKKAVPRARVVQLEDVGHSPQWEDPREVVDEILEFAD